MLKEDRIDIFFLGDFNEIEILDYIKQTPFTTRQRNVDIQYQQPYSNVIKENFARKSLGQSIIEIGYHCSVGYGDEQQMAMICCQWLVGSFFLILNCLQ